MLWLKVYALYTALTSPQPQPCLRVPHKPVWTLA